MSVAAEIYAALAGSEPLADVVGGKTSPNYIYQETDAPFVIYTITTGAVQETLIAGCGPVRVDFSVDCYHDTLAELLVLRDLVLAALADYNFTGYGPVDFVDEARVQHQQLTFYTFDLG